MIRPTTILLVEPNCPYCQEGLLSLMTHVYYVVVHPDTKPYVQFMDQVFIPIPERIPGVPALIVPHIQLGISPSKDEVATALTIGDVYIGLDPINEFITANKTVLTGLL